MILHYLSQCKQTCYIDHVNSFEQKVRFDSLSMKHKEMLSGTSQICDCTDHQVLYKPACVHAVGKTIEEQI